MTGLRLILMGPPGVGKGTQAERLVSARGIVHISTGDVFRRAMGEGTPMGRRAQPYVESGEYVPDEIVNGVVEERLAEPDCAEGFLLDGYPRTVAQAEALDDVLARQGRTLDGVVYLRAPDPEIVRRLTGRRVCSRCGAIYHVEFGPPRREGRCNACGGPVEQRGDDREETVRRRVQVYREQTAPLLQRYRERGLLLEVDGTGTIEEVARRIQGCLEERQSR